MVPNNPYMAPLFHSKSFPRRLGFSLVEMLVVIAIIGIITLISLPLITNFISTGEKTVAKINAQNTVGVSQKLSVIGVAHVLPESLGGAEATTRLLRRGIRVSEGPMQGKHFAISGISDENIEAAAIFMKIIFNDEVLQLGYNPNADFSP